MNAIRVVTTAQLSFGRIAGVHRLDVECGVREWSGLGDTRASLRDAGFSRSEAKALISRVKDLQRDAECIDGAVQAAQTLLNSMKG